MAKQSRRPPEVQAILRLRGNPYWSLQLDNDPVDEPSQTEAVAPDVRPRTTAEQEKVRLLGNQYAVLSLHDNPAASPTHRVSAPRPQHAARLQSKLSRAHFEGECRRIFAQYVPAVEKGRLRPHHRSFIARNVDRDPTERYNLVAALRKYDLSQVAGVQTHFNRGEALTEEKLQQIERSVLKS